MEPREQWWRLRAGQIRERFYTEFWKFGGLKLQEMQQSRQEVGVYLQTINPFFVTVLPSIESEDMVVPLKDNCLAGKLCFKIKTNKIWICFARHQPLCGIVGTWRRENFLNASKALSPACCIISIEATHCIWTGIFVLFGEGLPKCVLVEHWLPQGFLHARIHNDR